jgi:hypothetical protein
MGHEERENESSICFCLKPQTGESLRLDENACAALLRRKMAHFRIGGRQVRIVISG